MPLSRLREIPLHHGNPYDVTAGETPLYRWQHQVASLALFDLKLNTCIRKSVKNDEFQCYDSFDTCMDEL